MSYGYDCAIRRQQSPWEELREPRLPKDRRADIINNLSPDNAYEALCNKVVKPEEWSLCIARLNRYWACNTMRDTRRLSKKRRAGLIAIIDTP